MLTQQEVYGIIIKARKALSFLALVVIKEKKLKGYSSYSSIYSEYNLLLSTIESRYDNHYEDLEFQNLVQLLPAVNSIVGNTKGNINSSYTSIYLEENGIDTNIQAQIDHLLDLIKGSFSNFLALLDTPSSYENQAGKVPVVKEDETGLEFIDFPSSSTTEDRVASVGAGNINPGDLIPEGTDIQELVNLIFDKTFYPTFSNPIFSFSNSAGSLRVIGDVIGFYLIFQYTNGYINGESISGVWYPNNIAGFRTGNATSYVLNGNSGGNQQAITGYEVVKGMNTFSGLVNYAEGDQPKDSKGQDYNAPLPADSSPTLSTSFEGVYPLFATVSTLVNPNQLALYSMLTGNNIVIDLIAEINGNKQFFEIPKDWILSRPLQTIQYFNTVSNQYDTTNKLSDFTQSAEVKDINGVDIDYIRFTNNASDRGAIKIKLLF